MANQKSTLSAPRERTGTKPTTTKKVIPIDPDDTGLTARAAGSSPARDYFPMVLRTPAKKLNTPDDVDWEDIDGPILTRKLPSDWLDSPVNSALAEVAILEETGCGPDDICSLLTELSDSPALRLLVKKLRASLAKDDSPDNQDWETTLFAARLYWAGLQSGRREAAQNGGAK